MDKYPSLDQFYKTKHQIEFDKDLLALEKLDGTNCRFTIDYLGSLSIGSRNQLLDINAGDGQNYGVVGHIKALCADKKWLEYVPQDLMAGNSSEVTLYGEFFGKGIAEPYGEKEFRLFDVKLLTEVGEGETVVGGENPYWGDWTCVEAWSRLLKIETVPVLYRGPYNENLFDSLKSGPSTLNPDVRREGIVIKPFTPRRDSHGNPLIIKLKPVEKDEVKTVNPAAKSGLDSLQVSYVNTFIEHFVTENRLTHVIEQLREQGHACKGPEDTGNVIRQMSADVLKEGKDELPPVEWKEVAKKLTTVTKNLYVTYVQKENR